MTTSFDAIIIGTGQAGPSLAGRLTAAGLHVAIIERKRFGGTCVNNGCIPTKAMVASARAAYIAHRAADFGVMIDGTITVDMKKVKARKDAIVGKSSSGVESWLRNMKNCTVFTGHAQFENATTVRVNDEVLTADKIFIDVGARAFVPPFPGIEAIDYLDNSRIMDVDRVPEHLIIIGGSYIGLEFGQIYRRFGANVTIVEKNDRLIAREDEDVSAAVKDILTNEGITIECGAECMRFAKKRSKNSCHIRLQRQTTRDHWHTCFICHRTHAQHR